MQWFSATQSTMLRGPIVGWVGVQQPVIHRTCVSARLVGWQLVWGLPPPLP